MLLGRYAASSVIAGLISEGAFLASYGLGALPSVASVIAFVAGAVPNYLMNRYWAWQQKDKVRPGRELLPYLIIIVTTAVLASLITTCQKCDSMRECRKASAAVVINDARTAVVTMMIR